MADAKKLIMHILVTGHKGYIGGLLVPMLIQQGHQVTGCDRDFFANCLYLKESYEPINLNKDIRDLCADDLTAFDTIIHLAGLSNDPMGNFDPALTLAINQIASEQLAINARAAGVRRFIFASSCSNYGASDGGVLDESAPFNPQTPYGKSKCAAESTICQLETQDFSPCNLRAGTVYGIAPRIRFDLVVNNLVAYAVARGEVFLKSDGRAWRPLVHVSDVARAYVAALEAPASVVSGQSYNVGRTSENYQIYQVAQMIEAAVPDCNLKISDSAATDTRNYRVNCDKILKHLPAFKPQWTVEQGIDELYTSFSNKKIHEAAFEGSQYNRLAHLRQQIDSGVMSKDLRYR